jgi:proline iminopeptidase
MRVGDQIRFSHVELAEADFRDDARTIIAVPSGPGFSHRTLSPWLGGLARSFRVATVDLPGSGHGSTAEDLDYSFAAYVGDLDAVREKIERARVVLLGHGWGAAMAIEYALRYPSAVEALILVNPLRIFTGEGQDNEAQARMVARVDPGLVSDWTRDVAPAFQAALAGEAPWDAVEENPWWGRMIQTQFAAPPPAQWHEAMRAEPWRLRAYASYKGAAMFDPTSKMARYDLAERALTLRVPTLILSCDDDANYVAPPQRHAAALVETIANAKLVVWDKVGHFPFVERPADFTALVCDFLKPRL